MSVVCFGELLIDFVALESGVAVGEASGFSKAAGGAPANVAAGVARLGHPAAFMGQVGDDPFGHYLADVLAADGVNVDGLRFSDSARTALAFVSLAADGERSFVFYRHPSADMLMTPDDVRTDVIAGGRIFHFGSITLIHEPSAAATRHAVQIARDNGLLISYDPNLRMALWPSAEEARAGLLAGLDGAHIVKVSEEEIDFLADGDVSALWRPDMRLIVVTRGADGAIAHPRDGEPVYVPVPLSGITPVDTTGAGDSFVAGLLAGIMDHPDDYMARLPELLLFANACGALTTTQRGAIPSLPTRDQVLARLGG